MVSMNKICYIVFLAMVLCTPGITFCADKQADITVFDSLVDVVDLVERYYVTETGDEELVTDAINGMLGQLDPYSEYIPAKELADFQKQTSGNYEGIGIGIDIKDGYLTVISPFEDSPAYKAGVLPGDIIIEVDGQSTTDWSASRAVKELTGESGKTVTIKVLHFDETQEQITITRAPIHVPTVKGWRRQSLTDPWDHTLDDKGYIGYVRITQFTEETMADFDQVAQKLLAQDMKALVLDLRNNPGGLLSAAVDLVDRMLDQGVIVSTRGAHTEQEETMATAQGTYRRFHLVVLINQGSASAAEIVSGALQDNDRAVVVGKRSWGKGSVQRLIHLPKSGGAVKLTTDYYYLPKGRCVHRLPGARSWGVEPDIEEDIDPQKIAQLRELIAELTSPMPDKKTAEKADSEKPKTDSNDENEVDEVDNADGKAAGQLANEIKIKNQARKLLELDNQLSQAVKQCRGLLRVRPALEPLSVIGQQ